jgi:hypothetical protein
MCKRRVKNRNNERSERNERIERIERIERNDGTDECGKMDLVKLYITQPQAVRKKKVTY